MKLNKKIITGIGGGVLAVIVIALISAAGAKKKEAAKHEIEARMAHNESPRPVRFEKLKTSVVEKQRSFPGIVKASEVTALSFRVGGPLTEVHVKLGDARRTGRMQLVTSDVVVIEIGIGVTGRRGIDLEQPMSRFRAVIGIRERLRRINDELNPLVGTCQ